MRIIALGGIIGPILFTAIVLVCGALRPGYSHVERFISELGVPGTPYAALMNYAGFVPAGLMLALFGVAVSSVLRKDRLASAAGALIAAFGFGVAASGMISCDLGCPQGAGSMQNLVHNTIAPISFLCLIAAAGVLGIRFRSLPAWRHLFLYSILTSACGLGLLVLLAGSLEARVLTGLWQRLLLGVLFIWSAVVGLEAFRAPCRPQSRETEAKNG